MKRKTITVAVLLALVVAACWWHRRDHDHNGRADHDRRPRPRRQPRRAAKRTTTAVAIPWRSSVKPPTPIRHWLTKALGPSGAVGRGELEHRSGFDRPGSLKTWTRPRRRQGAGVLAQPECDTGSGGDLVMGYADGGGNDVNVWRSVSHMEAVLQALTYPEIGTIVSTAANFSPDPAVHINEHPVPDPDGGSSFIVGYPDVGVGLA